VGEFGSGMLGTATTASLSAGYSSTGQTGGTQFALAMAKESYIAII